MFSNPSLSFLKTLIKDELLGKDVTTALIFKKKSNLLQEVTSKSHCTRSTTIAEPVWRNIIYRMWPAQGSEFKAM